MNRRVVSETRDPRYTRGEDTPPYGMVGHMHLTEAQHAMLRTVEWTTVDPAKIPVPDSEIAAHPERKWGMQIPHRSALIVYATRGWPLVSTPDNAVLVFDARTEHPRAKPAIPLFIDGPSGDRLFARAVSRSCPAWPVERGDRVFIRLTETRAAQVARTDLDRLRDVPADYAAVMAEHADEADAVAASIAWAMTEGWPDIAHVTAAMAEHLNDPAAIADRTEASELRPGGPTGDAPAAAATDPKSPAADILASLTKLLESAIAVEFGDVTLTYIRGRAAADLATRERLIAVAQRQRDGGRGRELFLGCEIDGTYDEHGAQIPPREWLAMRSDVARKTLGGAMLQRKDADADTTRIVVMLERVCIGLCENIGAPPVDLGYMLIYQFVDADNEVQTSPVMFRHWPRAERDRAAAYLADVSAHPGHYARQLMQHAIAYLDFNEAIGGLLSDATVERVTAKGLA